MTGIPVNVGALTDGEKRAINKSGILFQNKLLIPTMTLSCVN